MWRGFRESRCLVAKRKRSCRSGYRFWASILTRRAFCEWRTRTNKPKARLARSAFWKLVVRFPSAAPAQHFSIVVQLSAEIDSFAADFACNPLTLVSRKLFRRQFDFHPLRGEEIFIRHLAVGEHLLLILVVNLWMHLACEI